MDSRLRGNDENEAGNDGSQRVPTPERVLQHPRFCVGMHTSPEKPTLQREMGMGSCAGTQRPENMGTRVF